MIQTHSEAVSPGLGVIGAGRIINLVVILKVGRARTLFLDKLGSIAVEVVASKVHAVVEKGPCTVGSAHPGGGDAVVVPVASAAAAHSAAATAHAAHHGTGKVVETSVVGIVAVGDERKLGFVGELPCKRRSLIAPVALHVGGRDVVTAAGHDIAEGALHHAGLDAEVDYRLFLTVVDAGELSLVGLLVHHFELVDYLGGNVLRGQLGVVQEEGLAIDGYLADGLAVVRYGAIFGHFYARELFEQVLKDVVLRGLERRCVVLYGVLLDDYRIAHGRHRCGVELLLVQFHLDFAEVFDVRNLDFLLISHVAEHLGFEGIGAGAYALYEHLAVGLAEHILGRLLGSFLGK